MSSAKDLCDVINYEFKLPTEAGLGFALLLGFGSETTIKNIYLGQRELEIIQGWIEEYLGMSAEEKDKVLNYLKNKVGD